MSSSSGAEHDDEALVAASLRGDRGAFGCLYDRYARLVRALVYDAFTDYAAAQDLTQEVFLRAHQKLGRLRRPERFGPWLVGIARQVCREKRRSLRRDRHLFVGAEPREPGTTPRAEESLMALEEQELALRRVAELPERERLAIHAFYLEGCSIRKTAALLGLSRSSAYALLRRGCRRVAEQLGCRECEVKVAE
jgi:RNA polymerase sigma-70 factor (ECF subfamily)